MITEYYAHPNKIFSYEKIRKMRVEMFVLP